jgi:hypothetical protein
MAAWSERCGKPTSDAIVQSKHPLKSAEIELFDSEFNQQRNVMGYATLYPRAYGTGHVGFGSTSHGCGGRI